MRYGSGSTGGTDTQTTLASSAGLLKNIDLATGDIPQTGTSWIENEKYGFNAREFAINTSAEFDSAITRTGRLSLKMQSLDATGVLRILPAPASNYSTAATNLANAHYFSPGKGSTKYRWSQWVRTNNVLSFLTDIHHLNSAGTAASTTSVTPVSGTYNFWRLMRSEFTSNSTTVKLAYIMYNTAGNTADTWLDVNDMLLEEIVEPVANTLSSASASIVSLTAVGAYDTDQSQLVNTSSLSFSTAAQYQAQQFTPTKSKLAGLTFMKKPNVGSPTGTMTFTIVNDNAGAPGTTVYATYVMSNAAYLAITQNTEFTVYLPTNVTTGTPYWCKISYSVSSGTDYPVIGAVTPSAYAGLLKYGTDGVTYGTTYNGDAYFYTLYYRPSTNYRLAQNNKVMNISSDEEGFIEGSVLNVQTGAWSFTDPVNDLAINNNQYFSRTTGCIFSGNTVQFSGASQEYRLKINLGLNATADLVYTIGFITNNTISYSFDNSVYTPLGTLVGAGGSYNIPMAGHSTVYIKNVANAAGSMTNHSATCTVDVSSLQVLKNYPTNKALRSWYTTALSTHRTSTATYRASKWGFPAIEYKPLGASSTGLLGRWEMLGNANDTSGNARNMSLTAAPGLTTGRWADANSAYLLDGTSQYLSTPTITDLNVSGYTVCFWINPVSKVTRSRPFASSSNLVTGYYGNAGGSGTNYQWFVGDGTSFSGGANAASFFTFGVWQFVAITYDKVTGRLYKDGVEFQNHAFAASVIDINGTFTYGSSGGNFCQGSFGEVYIFDRCLTPAEILAMSVVTQVPEYLEVDTTASGSVVKFSELGSVFTTMADNATLAITPTSNPTTWVDANITANRIYLSSNDYNANSDKDGSGKMSVIYQLKHTSPANKGFDMSGMDTLIQYGT